MAESNLEMLRIAARNLGDLKDELVFVGGCMTELLITDKAAAQPRQTKDVDAIVEAASYAKHIAETIKNFSMLYPDIWAVHRIPVGWELY